MLAVTVSGIRRAGKRPGFPGVVQAQNKHEKLCVIIRRNKTKPAYFNCFEQVDIYRLECEFA